MRRVSGRIRMCSAFLAAAVLGAASGMGAAGNAQDNGVSDASGGSSGPTTDTSEQPSSDLGGTPTSVESMSPDPDSKPNLGPVQKQQVNARNAVERGEVRPFGWLLKRLKKAVPGDIVKVRLKRSASGHWTYDVTVLNQSGRYVQVSLNAATGAIISTRYR